jgi:DNA-binding MarR family transcriptional regulator
MKLEELFRLFVRVQIELWETVDGALRADHDLSLVQYLPMRVISEMPDCRIQDVATTLHITSGGASQSIDRLAAAGYCTRRASTTDRRSSVVVLTSAGDALLLSAASTVDAALARRTAVLSDVARDRLNGILDLLNEEARS